MASVSETRLPGQMRYFVLSGSTRTGSYNTELATLAATEARARGADVELATVGDFPMPVYSEDDQSEVGFPAAAEALRSRVQRADAIVLASPEYNFSMPSVVKNVIDWLSRFRPQPFAQKQMLLMSASPSMGGGNRGLWALRVPLEHLGTRVYPDMFSLAQAHRAFTPDGSLSDEALLARFRSTVEGFMELAEAATHYPCVKYHWAEFPGERVDAPVTARAE